MFLYLLDPHHLKQHLKPGHPDIGLVVSNIETWISLKILEPKLVQTS